MTPARAYAHVGTRRCRGDALDRQRLIVLLMASVLVESAAVVEEVLDGFKPESAAVKESQLARTSR